MEKIILYYSSLLNYKTGAGVHSRSFLKHARKIYPNIKSFPLLSDDLKNVDKRIKYKHRSKIFLTFREVFVFVFSVIRTFVNIIKLVLNNQKSDVILYRLGKIDWTPLIISKIKKIPMAIEVNAPIKFERRRLKGEGIIGVYKIYENIYYRSSSHIFVVSAILRDYLISQDVSSEKITINPNGVDIELFNPFVSSNEVSSKLDLSSNFVLCFSGALQPWHDLDIVIEYLQTSNPRIKLLIIGDSPYLIDKKEKVEKLGLEDRVIFTGQVKHEQVPSFLAASHILLATYKKSTIFYFSPLKLYEYLAMGIPVIATRLGQIEELIKTCNGYLIEPENLSEFKLALNDIINNYDKVKENAINNHQIVSEKYSWKKNAEIVINICKNLQ